MAGHVPGPHKTAAEVRDDFDHVARIAEERRARLDGPAEPHERYLLRQLSEPCDWALEIGCGTGEFSRRLALRARDVVALDLSPEMIRVARSRSTGHPNIHFVVADLTALPFRDDAFECVASLNTLHHVDSVQALRAMRAALRPNGIVLIADVLDRPGLRNLLVNVVARLTRLVRAATVDRGTQRGALRRAYMKHGCGESHPTIAQARALAEAELPGAVVRGHLLWRYTVVWRG
jgi:ubiquinone/menaquinone biosynthesis C-methylase UbiE